MAEDRRRNIRSDTDDENDIQMIILDEIRTLSDKFDDLPCKVNTYKIGLLQKIVFGAVSLILIGFMATLLNKPCSHNGEASASTNTEISEHFYPIGADHDTLSK